MSTFPSFPEWFWDRDLKFENMFPGYDTEKWLSIIIYKWISECGRLVFYLYIGCDYSTIENFIRVPNVINNLLKQEREGQVLGLVTKFCMKRSVLKIVTRSKIHYLYSRDSGCVALHHFRSLEYNRVVASFPPAKSNSYFFNVASIYIILIIFFQSAVLAVISSLFLSPTNSRIPIYHLSIFIKQLKHRWHWKNNNILKVAFCQHVS